MANPESFHPEKDPQDEKTVATESATSEETDQATEESDEQILEEMRQGLSEELVS